MMTMSGSASSVGGGNGGGGAPPLQQPHHHGGMMAPQQRRYKPEDAAQHITVSDPVQHAEGMQKYTSYRVDVRPPAPTPGDEQQEILMANNTYSAVLRRYSDFCWLAERLHMERAGAIVPPLPDKQPVGRFSPAFVEDRRQHLERFIRRVAVHPELADAPSLDIFLRADDVSFQTAKNAKNNIPSNHMMMSQSQSFMMAHQPHMGVGGGMGQPSPNKKDGIKKWIAEAKTSMTGDLVRSPDDDLFDEINRYVSGLDTQMRNVSAQASSLVRKGKEIANGLFEFGLAFNLLGQSEADALGDALGKMGETADRLSVLSAEHAERELAQFEEPLQDYIKTIHAVKLALQRRHERRVTYSTCLAEVDTKNHQLAKQRGQLGAEAKAYATEMSLRRAHETTEAAQHEFAVVSQRVLREVDRFKREKAEDMRRVVLDYINLQVEYNKRMEEVWARLIPQLEQVQLDSGGGGSVVNRAPPPASVSPDPTQQQAQYPNNAGAPPLSLSSEPPQQQQLPPMPQQPPPPAPGGGYDGYAPQYGNTSSSSSSVPAPAPPRTSGNDNNISVQYREPPSNYGM